MTKLVKYILKPLQSEGPGHTDYPEADIAAHRSAAKANRWIGYSGSALLIAAFVIGPYSDPTMAFVGMVMFLGITQWVSHGLQIEALEWEVKLVKNAATEGEDE